MLKKVNLKNPVYIFLVKTIIQSSEIVSNV
jgi:hypothetical protein